MRERATELKESIRGSKTKLDHRSFFITTDGVTLPTLRGAYTSTRVRLTTSGIEARLLLLLLLQSYFLPFFFFFLFRTREKTRLGKISRIHFTRTAERRLVILFRMWFLRNWKPRHKCFPSVSRFRFLFFPAYFLIPSSRNSSARRIEEWAITESELLFFFSLSKNYSTICSIVA